MAEQVDVWKRERPALPFTIHIYPKTQQAYMVFNASTECCGLTVASEPIGYDLAVRLVNEFEMRPMVAR